MSAKLQQVHVRVNEKGTSNAVPVRILFATPEGEEFAPYGRVLEFGVDPFEDVGAQILFRNQRWFHIDGTCEIALPPGLIAIEATRGPEYLSLRETVQLLPGKLSLRLQIERWIDLRAQGWYSGDTNCLYLAPHTAALEGAAEDLAVVNLMVAPLEVSHAGGGHYDCISNIHAFSGQQPALERFGCQVVVNTLNSHNQWGILALLNSHRPVFPLTFGPPQGFDDWTLDDWCGQCHRKGGLVLALGYLDNSYNNTWERSEVLADVLLGGIDALNFSSFGEVDCLEEWYLLLNAGLRLPLTAGSGKDANIVALGFPRTYAYLSEPFSYRSWIEAIRAGRIFVTHGPLLRFQDRLPGEVIDVPEPGTPIRLGILVEGTPLPGVEVVHDGRVVQTLSGSTTHEIELIVTEPGWVALRCVPRHDGDGECISAHTSPIYLTVGGQARRCPVELAEQLDQRLQTMLDWVEKNGRFENDQQKQRMASVYLRARERLKGVV